MKAEARNEYLIRLQDVSKSYKSGKENLTALHGINFHAQAGEMVLIQGPSGSGKTTLLTVIAGLIKPSGGKVELFNEEICNYNSQSLQKFRAKNIGFVFQNFLLIDSLSVIENIILAEGFAGTKGKEAKQKGLEILKRLNIAHLEKKYPKEISQGEKQRTAMGRAIVNNANIILADEPTANLDSENGLDVIRLLHNYAKQQNRCVVIASHDLRIRDYADRILNLEYGKLS